MKDNFHLIFLVPCCILYKFVNFVQSSFLFRSSFIVCVYTLDFRLISYNSPIAMGSYQRALMILKMKSKSGFFREKLHVHYVDSKSRMEALSCQRFLTVCSQSLCQCHLSPVSEDLLFIFDFYFRKNQLCVISQPFNFHFPLLKSSNETFRSGYI